jgi:hypothetical protein
MDKQQSADAAAQLLGALLVARRDAKALYLPAGTHHDGSPRPAGWVAQRSKFTKGDFRAHLLDTKCLGTYLHSRESTCKFVAFDIDLKPEGPYFIVRDLDELERMEAQGAYEGTLDPDARVGPLEAALHDPDMEAHRWARCLVRETAMRVAAQVDKVLNLPVLPVVTGGGAHVIVPFGDLVPGVEARAMAHSVLENVAGFWRKSESFYKNAPDDVEGWVEIEVFPKQDGLSEPDSLGNLLRLPLGWHLEANMRTYFLDLQRSVPPWDLPRRRSLDTLRECAEALGLDA